MEIHSSSVNDNVGTQLTELHINRIRCGWLTVIEKLSFAFTINGGLGLGVF